MNNKGKRKMEEVKKEEIAENWCFVCYDGGELLLCDEEKCLKAYHPSCVGKDDSFLHSNRPWTCARHLCFLCNRASYFHCYTCKHAVCHRCIPSAAFVRVKGTNGFCDECRKLALLIEEEKDYDSDGCQVDFNDRETFEGLFKEYYDIIKKDERFKLQDILDARDRKKKNDPLTESSSDEYDEDEEEERSDYDEGLEAGKKRRRMPEGKRSERRKPAKQTRPKSNKMEFVGWGSKPLINFLTSIGKSTVEKLSQHEVASIVAEYIRANKLVHPEKKKVVRCDDQLLPLFKRRELNRHRVYDLLEAHLLENLDESEEDELQNDLGKTNSGTAHASGSKKKLDMEKKTEKNKINNGVPRTVYAAIVAENLKLIYLKRSLLRELLKEPESFEEKVVGCFVGVRDSLLRDHLMQIKGIKTVTVGENRTETVLLLSDMQESLISKLRDFNPKELQDQCLELRQKVQAGLLERPTVVEFQKKAELLHKDMTNHWISWELRALPHRIDRANEKGWRQEYHELLKERRRLQDPSEQSRLLDTVPNVIPDTSEFESNSEDIKDDVKTDDGSPEPIKQCNSTAPGDGGHEERTSGEKIPLGNASPEKRRPIVESYRRRNPQHDHTPVPDIKLKNTHCGDPSQLADQEKKKKSEASHSHSGEEARLKKTPKSSQMVIELLSDDENPIDDNVVYVPETDQKEIDMWCFLGPDGENGKCSWSMLKFLNGFGSKASKFKVWREDQNEENAILLPEAIKVAFLKK